MDTFALTVALHNRLVDKDGKPIVHENVHISLTTSYGTKQGALTAGFGATQEKLGPELAFGATMHEKLQEPILIIKTAWGGKTLHTDFRSPSAGPYVFNPFQLDNYPKNNKTTVEELNAAKAKETGHFYRLMTEHVKMVLADKDPRHVEFQKAMAAAADLPEFEGNVFAVHAGFYWDKLQGEADKKKWKIRAEAKELVQQGKLAPKEQADYERKRLAEIHTPEEAIAFKGISNSPYHYLGSANILSRIGEAFAEALIHKKENK
jgi:hypothetical protein